MKKDIIRIENKFVFNAYYHLTANEYKVLTYLLSQLNPREQDRFHRQRIPVKKFVEIVTGENTKWGQVYDLVTTFSDNLFKKTIQFPTGFKIDGREVKGKLHWFQYVTPSKDEHGEWCIEFLFAEPLIPYLLRLKEYVAIHRDVILPMRSSHAIHMLTVLKAERDRTRAHKQVSVISYEIEELKAMLGIPGKYSAIKDFKKYVLKPIEEEINLYSDKINVHFKNAKDGRRVTGIKFFVTDKKGAVPEFQDYIPDEIEVDMLPKARKMAYEILVEFGVKPGIAFKQFLPTIKGSEIDGFEDYFVDAALSHFRKWSSSPSPATFVNWWHDKKIFTVQSDVWGKLLEQVIAHKKVLLDKNPVAYENRMYARGVSNKDFRKKFGKKST